MYIEVTYPNNETNISTGEAPVIVYVQYDDGIEPIRSLSTNVRNQTGSTVPAMSVVYISGATGNKPTIALASNTTEATSSKTYGITSASISNNGTGEVITVGELINVDTSAYTEGQALWLGSTAGSIVTTVPTQPNHAVFLGYIVRSHPNFGIIDIRIQNGYELQELHNLLITSVANNNTIKYDSATSLWKNKMLLQDAPAPATSSSTGVIGDVRMDSSYIYVCTATNTWKRIALSSF